MARLTRHQLKDEDAFEHRLTAIWDALMENRALAGKIVLSIVAVVVLALGVYWYVSRQQAKANEALAMALETYHAPVFATPPQSFTGESYKTDKEKYQKALEKFQQVAAKYSWYSAGRWARYYAALSQREMGNLTEAEKELQALSGKGGEDFSSLAKLALASVYQQEGKTQEAENLLKQLEERPTVTVPKARAQMARANLYLASNPAQAAQIYQEIQKEYEGTEAGDQASKIAADLSR